MNGCYVNNKWFAAFGAYDVPQAIMWLADKAQSLHHLPPMSIATTQFRKFWDDPGFKVVEEWGTWRDSIERVDYENADEAS
jgi:hypothetical protein